MAETNGRNTSESASIENGASDAHMKTASMAEGEGAVAGEDTDMALPPERVARNIALHLAAGAGNLAECETLLDCDDDGGDGADAWWEDEDHLGWSALHHAADGGHRDVAMLLLRRGALWNAGKSAIHRDLEA